MDENKVVDVVVVPTATPEVKTGETLEAAVVTSEIKIGEAPTEAFQKPATAIPVDAIVNKAVAAIAEEIDDVLATPKSAFEKVEITEEGIMDSELLLSVYLDFAAALRSCPMQMVEGKAARDGILLALKAEIKGAAKMILEAKKQLKEGK